MDYHSKWCFLGQRKFLAGLSSFHSDDGKEELQIDEDQSLEIQLYPNPVKHELTLDLGNEGNTIIEIYDSYGKIVADHETTKKQIQISVVELEAGMYVARVVRDQKSRSLRFVVVD